MRAGVESHTVALSAILYPGVLYPAVLAFSAYRAGVQKTQRELAPLEARITLLETQLDESLALSSADE